MDINLLLEAALLSRPESTTAAPNPPDEHHPEPATPNYLRHNPEEQTWRSIVESIEKAAALLEQPPTEIEPLQALLAQVCHEVRAPSQDPVRTLSPPILTLSPARLDACS